MKHVPKFAFKRSGKSTQPYTLRPGDVVKVKGARDGVGLRKVISIDLFTNTAMVDHYRWRKDAGKMDSNIYTIERIPYSSVVKIKNISHRIIMSGNSMFNSEYASLEDQFSSGSYIVKLSEVK